MASHKGWIALDIDGTITDQLHHVPPEVYSYLKSVYQEGWQLIFITGRTFSFGASALHGIDFPFFLAVQNGADILLMPEKKRISRSYLSGGVICFLENIYADLEEDFIVYAGYEKGDFCYYRPDRFSPNLITHLEKIRKLSPEPWRRVDAFTFILHKTFPLIKCLGSREAMEEISASLKQIKGTCATLIRDPLEEGIYLNLITDQKANKGDALKKAIAHFGERGRVIAAGDDQNDMSMLDVADCKIVMRTAPIEMHPLADILSESADKLGILDALTQAIGYA